MGKETDRETNMQGVYIHLSPNTEDKVPKRSRKFIFSLFFGSKNSERQRILSLPLRLMPENTSDNQMIILTTPDLEYYRNSYRERDIATPTTADVFL